MFLSEDWISPPQAAAERQFRRQGRRCGLSRGCVYARIRLQYTVWESVGIRGSSLRARRLVFGKHKLSSHRKSLPASDPILSLRCAHAIAKSGAVSSLLTGALY